MILKSLVMENFRQFRGVHQLRFACEDETPGCNVTVIFGENGRGKTGIFRAIVFCLFGEKYLSQDGEALERELNLVNTHEVQVNSKSEGGPVEAFVELEFAHRANVYKLRRGLLAMEQRGKAVEESSEVRLTIQSPEGNTQVVTDPQDVHEHVTSILDPRVSEYFLFDGEKMERLTHASAQQRREVSKGIRNLLNIDALEVAISAMRGVCRALDKEIRDKSTGEHARVIKQINESEDQQDRLKGRLGKMEQELEYAEQEKRSVDVELDKFREIKGLLEERKRLEDDEANTQEQLSNLLTEMRGQAGKAAIDLVVDTLQKVFDGINEKKKRGEIPPEIRGDLIEKILSDQKCICGREVKPDTRAHGCILGWKARSGDQQLSDTALDLWRYLSTILARVKDVRQATDATLQKYANARHQLKKIQQRHETVAERIGASARADAAKLEGHRKQIEGKVVSLTAEEQRLTQDLDALVATLGTLRADRKRLEHDESIRNELVQRSDLASATLAALEEVFDEFRTEIRDELGKKATDILGRLLDAESRKSLTQVVVNEDYSLQVLNRWREPFLANISAGQRQIMSVSFIASLAQAAAGGEMLEMPLFMDTPFGRLSFEHRKNLILELPELCAQWVLLATDTELRQPEGRLLLTSGRWGKFYILRGTEDGSTVVDERRTGDALAVLLREEAAR